MRRRYNTATIHILVQIRSFEPGLKRSWEGQKRTVLFAEKHRFTNFPFVPFFDPV